MRIKFMKFEENDFNDYFNLVRNEKVMAQITERSIPFDEAQVNFQKILKLNQQDERLGTYRVVETSDKKFIGLAGP